LLFGVFLVSPYTCRQRGIRGTASTGQKGPGAREGPEFLIDLIAASSRLGLAPAFADAAEEETRRWRRYNDSKEKTGGLGNWI